MLSGFDFLPAAFREHGRPQQLYGDYHTSFFTHEPNALTQLGGALKFYDLNLRDAPTPQANGKIERAHQFWQGRLPAGFTSEKIVDLAMANVESDALRAHRNAHEIHRELRQTPQRAWEQARKEKRSGLAPGPAQRVATRGLWKIKSGCRPADALRTETVRAPAKLYHHPKSAPMAAAHRHATAADQETSRHQSHPRSPSPGGHHSVRAAPPDPQQKPVRRFTNPPK